MKRRVIVPFLLALIFSMLVGCAEKNTKTAGQEEPEITQIRSICEMATLECYYHNVAKAVKEPEKGILHIGEKARKFWIEYDGIVKLGIEMTDVKMRVDGESVKITIPKAKVLDVKVNETSYNKDSFVVDSDGFNENKITAEDATKAVNDAKKQMKKTAQENSALLMNAQDRAKKMIENYIHQLGDITGVNYKISWDYMNNDDEDSSEDSEDPEAVKSASDEEE